MNSRGSVNRLRAQIANARAALPPFIAVIEPQGDAESAKAFEARKANALRPARGRKARLIIVDRHEGDAT